MYDLELLRRSETDRRAFLTRMSAAGLGAAAIALMAGCGDSGSNNNGNGTSATPDLATTRSAFSVTSAGITTPVPGANQNQIVLNYALSLEYLEADLYRQALNAASGRALTTALDGTTPTGNQTPAVSSTAPTGNSAGAYTLQVPSTGVASQFVTAAFLYLVQFAYVEASHRDFLSTVLGGAASPLQGRTKSYVFPAGTDATTLGGILNAIYPLEETGTRAYLGAGKYLQDNPTVEVAVSIYSTECRHSAALAYLLGLDPGPRTGITNVPPGEYEVAVAPATANGATNIFEKALTPSSVLTGILPLLA